MYKNLLFLTILCGLLFSTQGITGDFFPYPIGQQSRCLKTGQTTSYHADDDGALEKGIARFYTVLDSGQYAGTSNITINGKTHALSNECVRDNRTGLMWARYVPDADIGPATDGKLFWDQWTLAAESCTFATAGDTITAAAGTPFDIGALCVGRKITITGTANNNGIVTVTGITTSEITVAENLTDEGPVNTTFATLDDLIWDFLSQANANSLGGYTDWRISNMFELLSIVNIKNASPAINTTIFPSTASALHWASSTYVNNVLFAWYVTFTTGDSSAKIKKKEKHYCRLVRGGPN